MLSPRTQLAWLSLAMFLGMTLWFSATAANAAIVAEFHLTAAETAWLTMAVQAGFVIGTLVSAVLNLPDIINRAGCSTSGVSSGRWRTQASASRPARARSSCCASSLAQRSRGYIHQA